MTACQGCEKPIRKHHKYCRSCGFLRVAEVRERLRICRATLSGLIDSGRLRTVKDRRYVRLVRREDVEALLHPEWGWGPKRK
jgi:excisionase family DNA binding protein